MTVERLAEQSPTKHDFACRSCGRWVVTAPCSWARARCANRRCRLFGQQQTMYAGQVAEPRLLRTNDS